MAFTLVEMMVVVGIIGVGMGSAYLTMKDFDSSQQILSLENLVNSKISKENILSLSGKNPCSKLSLLKNKDFFTIFREKECKKGFLKKIEENDGKFRVSIKNNPEIFVNKKINSEKISFSRAQRFIEFKNENYKNFEITFNGKKSGEEIEFIYFKTKNQNTEKKQNKILIKKIEGFNLKNEKIYGGVLDIFLKEHTFGKKFYFGNIEIKNPKIFIENPDGKITNFYVK